MYRLKLTPDGRKPLSKREAMIVDMVSEGKTDKEVARELGISCATINTHWSRIRLKLNVDSRTEAVSVILQERARNQQSKIEEEKESLLGEIAQHEELEADLRRSERRVRHLFENLPGMVVATDAKGLITDANRWCLGRLGYSLDEVLNRPLCTIFYGPSSRVEEQRFIEAIRTSEGRLEHTFRVLCRDGAVFAAVLEGLATIDPDGREILLFGIRDVSERDQLKAALNSEIERRDFGQRIVAALYDALPVGIMTVGPAGDVRMANGKAYEMWPGLETRMGQNIGQIQSFTVVDAKSKSVVDRSEYPVARALRGERVVGSECQVYDDKGGMIPTRINAFPVLGASGKVIGAAITFEDLRKTEADKKELESQSGVATGLKDLIEGLPIVFLALDDQGRVAVWNREANELSGYTQQELQEFADPLSVLFPDSEVTTYLAISVPGLTDFDGIEWDIATKTGRRRTLRWTRFSERVRIPGWSICLVGMDLDRSVRESAIDPLEGLASIVSEQGPGPMMVVNGLTGKIDHCNIDFENLVGASAGQLLGRFGFELYAEGFDFRPIHYKLVEEMQAGHSTEIEAVYRRWDGGPSFKAKFRLVPNLDSKNVIQHVAAFFVSSS